MLAAVLCPQIDLLIAAVVSGLSFYNLSGS